MMADMRDEFLSEDDLDLQNLSEDELMAAWDAWLLQAQATNDLDRHTYSHGVFTDEPDDGVNRVLSRGMSPQPRSSS